jgi:hypothetical protein
MGIAKAPERGSKLIQNPTAEYRTEKQKFEKQPDGEDSEIRSRKNEKIGKIKDRNI